MAHIQTRFVSLRWRTLLPIMVLVMLPAAGVAYLLVMGTQVEVDPGVQQAFAVGAAGFSGTLVAAIFLMVTALSRRTKRITNTLQNLKAGQHTVRTEMQPIDEIGKIGYAVDKYADYVQDKQDDLRKALRRKRREVAHLLSVLEAMPDGVIVQDLDGRVILMNDPARKLLGSSRVFRSSGLHELTALVTDKLGPMLSPGLYALGDPQRVELDGKMLSAQAAAVLSQAEARLGTVILLRDISDMVKRERSRDAMLERLAKDIQQPIAQMAREGLQSGGMLGDFARELTRRAIALQKMIVELRDIDDVDETTVQRSQRPVSLDMMIWSVVNEWRQIAQANQHKLQVNIEHPGLHVLGDERRLRWAVGNLVDNGIKYTPPGGTIILEIRGEEDGFAQLRIRDNGVGIMPQETENLFTRFWRGNPTIKDGRVIRVPGMGQGLFIAKRIFEAHGGKIQVRSKIGTGTAVYFMLPLTASVGFELPQIYAPDEYDSETVPLQPSDATQRVGSNPTKPNPTIN